MNYALIGALFFLMVINLTSGLKGKDGKEKIKIIFSFFWFFLLFGVLMISYHYFSSQISENPIIQKITQ